MYPPDMPDATNPEMNGPRRLSRRLCGAIALVLAAVHLGVLLAAVSARRADLLERASQRLASVIAAVGPERDADALRARLKLLRSTGINTLRAVDFEGEALEERENDLVFRASGLEVRMSLEAIDGAVQGHAFALFLAGLLSIGAACGAAWLFLQRDRTIQAAEQVDEYAHRLERQNQALFAAKRHAESADRAKTEFLANISHELRTPLTAILGFTDVLVQKAGANLADASHLEDARTIQRNGHYLYRLLAGLLDFANLEAGRLRVHWHVCSPVEILRDIELVSRPGAEEKGLRLRVEIPDDVPAHITSDATRVRQILSQLVENAIKFTGQGSVTLRVALQREGYPQHHVAFDVIDTGIGMSEGQISTLFEPFAQGDGSRSRQHGGLGLGLALAHRLARRLRGEITVVSTTSEGSAFRLALPLEPRRTGPAQPEAEEQQLAADSGPIDCRVLVAEDGPDNRKLIDLILRQAGAQVTMVDNGKEAVDLAMEAWRGDEPFDVILMDMQMPVTDGICATQALRLQNYSGVIIALTADARAANREECLKAGCDEFLSKPIDRGLLLATIRALLKPVVEPRGQ